MKEQIDLAKYTQFVNEISNQPTWRYKADREADYYDGNQLDSEILQAQKDLGIPPAIEPLIGPTIDSVLGMEIMSRRDWRVVPEIGSDDLALALSSKLNKAEKRSGADTACTAAYASQVKTGIGWVEVGTNPNPFEYKHRCTFVHRNEIWWDWLSRRNDISNARYLMRRKWLDVEQAALMFPAKRKLIEEIGNGWPGGNPGELFEGGESTDLAMSFLDERGWSVEEMEWMDTLNDRISLFELWYRVWERVIVLKGKNGMVAELDKSKPSHIAALATGFATPQYATVHRPRLSWWVGPHLLWDGPSPYKHNHFPYVPFWGKREDRTASPYGLIRGMMYLQDEVNARISKMQWLLSAVRSERTDGAVMMSDTEFNNEVSRPDADIKLDAEHMAKPGAVFNVHRDHQLSQQQFGRLVDAREGIQRTGGIYKAFQGMDDKGAHSNVALNTLVQQSSQTLATINDNFRAGRMMVGDLMLSNIIAEIGDEQHEVEVKGGIVRDDTVIVLNAKQTDESGTEYMDNNIQQAKLGVELEDVPSTPTFRAQQLQVLGAAIKNMPPKYQSIMMPFMMALMDMPYHDELMEAIRNADEQMSPEKIQELIKAEVEKELLKAKIDIENRKLDIKEAEAEKDVVETGIKATKEALDVAAIIAAHPELAGIAQAALEVAANLNEDPAKEVPVAVPQPSNAIQGGGADTQPANPQGQGAVQ